MDTGEDLRDNMDTGWTAPPLNQYSQAFLDKHFHKILNHLDKTCNVLTDFYIKLDQPIKHLDEVSRINLRNWFHEEGDLESILNKILGVWEELNDIGGYIYETKERLFEEQILWRGSLQSNIKLFDELYSRGLIYSNVDRARAYHRWECIFIIENEPRKIVYNELNKIDWGSGPIYLRSLSGLKVLIDIDAAMKGYIQHPNNKLGGTKYPILSCFTFMGEKINPKTWKVSTSALNSGTKKEVTIRSEMMNIWTTVYAVDEKDLPENQ